MKQSGKRGRPSATQSLPLLEPVQEKPTIKKVKYDNLQSLLPYVPPWYYDFFNSINYENQPRQGRNESEDIEAGPSNIYDTDDEWTLY